MLLHCKNTKRINTKQGKRKKSARRDILCDDKFDFIPSAQGTERPGREVIIKTGKSYNYSSYN